MALETVLEDRIVGVLVFDGSPNKGAIKHKELAAGVAIVATTGPRGLTGDQGPRGPGWSGGFGGPPEISTVTEIYGDFYLNYDDGVVYQIQGDPNDPHSWFWGNRVDISGPSAYDIAVNLGYGGTEQDWIDSIRGFYLADSPDDEPPEGTPDRTFVFERA